MSVVINSSVAGGGGGTVNSISDVPGLEAALDGKLGADQAIPVSPKATPMVAGDTLLGTTITAIGVLGQPGYVPAGGPVTFTMEQVAASVLTQPQAIAGITYVDGSPATVTEVGGAVTSLTYNADGSPATVTSGGITETVVYNPDGTVASFA